MFYLNCLVNTATVFYGSQAWGHRSKHVQGLYRALNRGVRRIQDLPYDCHLFLLPLLLNMQSLEVQLVKICVKQCIVLNTNLCL